MSDRWWPGRGKKGPRELKRLSGAIQFMELYSQPRRGLSLRVVHVNKGTAREVISDIQKRVTRLQVEHLGRRPYNVTTYESRGGLHAHIVFLGTPEIVERLRASTTWGRIIQVDPVTDPNGLARRYLAKERTPQAGYRRNHVLGGRLRGSHQLEGGGDRVRLSRDPERDALEAGYVEPWQHTNARRAAQRKPYSPRANQRLGNISTGEVLDEVAEDGKALMWAAYPDKLKAKLGELTRKMVFMKGIDVLPACGD